MKFFYVLILWFASLGLGFGDVVVAQFHSLGSEVLSTEKSSDFSKDFFKALMNQDKTVVLGLQFADVQQSEGAINSMLDADRFCRQKGVGILVYGHYSSTDVSFDVEINVYDFFKKSLVKTFLLRTKIDDYQSFVQDSSLKVYEYLYGLFVDVSQRGKSLERNAIIQSYGLGYGSPLSEWFDIAQPLGFVSFQLLARLKPFYTSSSLDIMFLFGLGIEFEMLVNKNQTIPWQWYMLDAGLPLGFSFVFAKQHDIRLLTSPLVRFSYYSHTPFLSDLQSGFLTWYGASLSLGYMVWLDQEKKFALGLDFLSRLYFTQPLFWELRSSFNFGFKSEL